MKYLQLVLLSFLVFVFTPSTEAEEQEQVVFSQAELEQMLAPIALYPDSVLTHVLIASTYPLEVIQAERWASKNSKLDAADALEKVEDENWDPSIKALVPFPRVLERLSEDLEWTQKLGDAFLQDEERILDAIQSLRRRADQAGNLDNMENMKVNREEQVIMIEPARPEVVYVPYYDTRVIYGPWHWNHYPPVYWNHYRHHNYHHAYHSPYYWHSGIHISHNFYFGAFHWHNRHLVVIHPNHWRSRHYRHPARTYHREQIIRHTDGQRWTHNPRHRRGVAYRTNQARDRYQSNRPSRAQTHRVRHTERQISAEQRRTRVSNRDTVRPGHRQSERVTRQNRLQQQLRQREVAAQRTRTNGTVRTNTNRSSVRQNNDVRATNRSSNRSVRTSNPGRQIERREITSPARVNDRTSSNNRAADTNGDKRVSSPSTARTPSSPPKRSNSQPSYKRQNDAQRSPSYNNRRSNSSQNTRSKNVRNSSKRSNSRRAGSKKESR